MTSDDEGEPDASSNAGHRTRLSYSDTLTRLRESYDRGADERERASLPGWKVAERQRCLAAFQDAGCRTLLEIGAGTGKDSAFFAQHGLDVTAVDPSPAMVAWCRRKGLRVVERDVLQLGFPEASFDAVYSINCLLHVPKRDLPAALTALGVVVRPGGLVYVGLYGGIDVEGVWPEDQHEPKRFFSYHTDDGIYQAVEKVFDVLAFSCIAVERIAALHFQSLLLQRSTMAGFVWG